MCTKYKCVSICVLCVCDIINFFAYLYKHLTNREQTLYIYMFGIQTTLCMQWLNEKHKCKIKIDSEAFVAIFL